MAVRKTVRGGGWALVALACTCTALAAPPVRRDVSLYAWDAQLARIPAAHRPPNLVVAVHNGWDFPAESEAFTEPPPADAAAFAERWRCELEEKGSVAVAWERQWAAPHAADVPERWVDRLHGERPIGQKSLLPILDEQPGVEQWATVARLLPEHRKLFQRLMNGSVAASLHFWLLLRLLSRVVATRNPTPSYSQESVNFAKEVGLAETALAPRERAAIAPLLRRYYVAARVAGVPDPPGGDWSLVDFGMRPSVTPNDPLYLYVSPPAGPAGERQLSLRNSRQGPDIPMQGPQTPIWITSKSVDNQWDIAFPNLPAHGEPTGWLPEGRLALTGAKADDRIRIAGRCYTRSLSEVLEELGRLAGEKLAPERELADRSVTLLLTGISPTELKAALARAFHARWRQASQNGKPNSESLVLELTPEARKLMAAERRNAISGDPDRVSNGLERLQLRKDLLDALPPERRAELERLGADDPEAGIRVSWGEFSPGMQRRLLDQAYHEDWVSERSGLASRFRVDLGRLDDIQVSYHMQNGQPAFWVFRLPLTGGGYLEY
jgi:hypothetical protein